MIYYQTHLTFWLTDVKPQPARPLQNVNNLTLCCTNGDRTPPVIQKLNWSRHLLSDWWHSQNPSTFLHWPDYVRVRVLAGVCLCGTVEVIISSGRRDFLVAVVAPRGAVPSRDSQLVSLNSPPFCCPLSPTRLLFPLKLHSVNLWRGSAPIFQSFDTEEKRESEGKSCEGILRRL